MVVMDNTTSETTNPPQSVPPAAQAATPPNTPQPVQPVSQGMSNDTKSIITILLLIFVAPVGFIVMWFFPKWPLWLKFVISLPALLFMGAILVAITLVAVNPAEQIKAADCAQFCSAQNDKESCLKSCILSPQLTPTSSPLQ